jgi:hypothetical protein
VKAVAIRVRSRDDARCIEAGRCRGERIRNVECLQDPFGRAQEAVTRVVGIRVASRDGARRIDAGRCRGERTRNIERLEGPVRSTQESMAHIVAGSGDQVCVRKGSGDRSRCINAGGRRVKGARRIDRLKGTLGGLQEAVGLEVCVPIIASENTGWVNCLRGCPNGSWKIDQYQRAVGGTQEATRREGLYVREVGTCDLSLWIDAGGAGVDSARDIESRRLQYIRKPRPPLEYP